MEAFAGTDPAALIAAACAPAMRERAREMAAAMAFEDGVGTAADRILGGTARLALP